MLLDDNIYCSICGAELDWSIEIKYESSIATDSVYYVSECCSKEYKVTINEDGMIKLNQED